MAIVGELVRSGFEGGPQTLMGRSSGAGATEAVVTGFHQVLFVFCSYTEDPGDVQPCYGVDSSGTVTFTMTTDKQIDFLIVGTI